MSLLHSSKPLAFWKPSIFIPVLMRCECMNAVSCPFLSHLASKWTWPRTQLNFCKNFSPESINCCPAVLLQFWCPIRTLAIIEVHCLTYLQREIVITIPGLLNDKCFCPSNILMKKCLTRWVLIPQNGQTHSNNSSANCQRIVWMCLTILWNWR